MFQTDLTHCSSSTSSLELILLKERFLAISIYNSLCISFSSFLCQNNLFVSSYWVCSSYLVKKIKLLTKIFLVVHDNWTKKAEIGISPAFWRPIFKYKLIALHQNGKTARYKTSNGVAIVFYMLRESFCGVGFFGTFFSTAKYWGQLTVELLYLSNRLLQNYQ